MASHQDTTIHNLRPGVGHYGFHSSTHPFIPHTYLFFFGTLQVALHSHLRISSFCRQPHQYPSGQARTGRPPLSPVEVSQTWKLPLHQVCASTRCTLGLMYMLAGGSLACTRLLIDPGCEFEGWRSHTYAPSLHYASRAALAYACLLPALRSSSRDSPVVSAPNMSSFSPDFGAPSLACAMCYQVSRGKVVESTQLWICVSFHRRSAARCTWESHQSSSAKSPCSMTPCSCSSYASPLEPELQAGRPVTSLTNCCSYSRVPWTATYLAP